MQSIRKKLAGKISKLGLPQEPVDEHPASLNDYQHGTFCQVEIERILPNPHQPRTHFDQGALEDLAASIKEKGVLQPVIVRKEIDGQIYLVAGERRLRASKMAGLTKIPAILTKDNPAEIAIIENLQRENLSPLEEAEAFARMVNEYHYTLEQLGKVVGKAKSTISEMISLNRIPPEIKAEIRHAEHISRRTLVEIAKQKTPEAMFSLFHEITNGKLTSVDVRKITRKPAERSGRSPGIVVVERMNTLSKNLRKLDVPALSEEEKAQLKKEAATLQQLLEGLPFF